MRVKCIRIINRMTGIEERQRYALTVGGEYVVLAVQASPGRSVELRIMDDEGTVPALFTSDQFETTSAEMPSTWRARVSAGGILDLAPQSWLRAGFWEDFFNGDPAARQEFEQERAMIMDGSN